MSALTFIVTVQRYLLPTAVRIPNFGKVANGWRAARVAFGLQVLKISKKPHLEAVGQQPSVCFLRTGTNRPKINF